MGDIALALHAANDWEAASESINPTVGLIGIGLMGTALAERMLAAGWRVVGWDVAEERRDALAERGGSAAAGIADVVARCERVVLSLPTDETVSEVLDAAQDALRAGQTIIDTSTGDPEAAARQARQLAERGIAFLDATVSGSSVQLRKDEAVLLVGGTEAAFAGCRDLFAGWAAKVFHTGPAGSGARMKLVTNLVLGLNRAALAEGLTLARALELDGDQALALLRESMAYSRIMDSKGEKMLRGDFTPQAKLSQHLKDVRLMLAAAQRAQAALPLTKTHRQILEHAERLGLGELDNSAIVRAIEEWQAMEKGG